MLTDAVSDSNILTASDGSRLGLLEKPTLEGRFYEVYVTRRVKKDMLSANTVLRYRPVSL